MMPDDRPLVILVHAAGPGPYAEAVRRARLIQLGAEQWHARVRFDRVLGRTPDDDPVTEAAPAMHRLLDYARRMIQGDDETGSGQNSLLSLPGADRVWIVSERTGDVEDQVSFAVAAGIDVDVVPRRVQERLLRAGRDAERREAAQRAEDLAPKHDQPAFSSAEAVVYAFFCGADSFLGVQALPLARLMRCGGNAHGRKDRAETAGLRIAMANGTMRRAMASPRWCKEMLPVLRVAFIERGSMESAAQRLELGEGDSARRQASRLKARALDLIREAMKPDAKEAAA